MPIERIELYELTLPLVEPFIISGGTMTERRSLVVVIHDDQGRQGYGESPPFELPFYSEETLVSARDLLERVLIPRLLEAASRSRPRTVDSVLRVGVRGNPFARAALETAAWDLEAARRNTSLAALLGERVEVKPAAGIPCGVALGIPHDRSTRDPAPLDRRVARPGAISGSRSRSHRDGTRRPSRPPGTRWRDRGFP